MKKTFSNNSSLVRFLMSEVMRATDFFDQGFICWDFVVESEKISDWVTSDDPRHNYPFYVCIRRYGVESGPKNYVEYRLGTFKDLINVYVIRKCEDGYEVEVRERI